MAKRSAKSSQIDASMRIIVLHGKETFLIDQQTKHLIAALETEFGGVQIFQFNGDVATTSDVLDELRTFGLLEKHKLIVVDLADEFLADRDDEDQAEPKKKSPANQTRRLLEKYAENPESDSTLLLRAATWRKGNLDKLIAKVGVVIKCEDVDDQFATKWCQDHVRSEYNATIERDAADLLVARLGPSLTRLNTELAKLSNLAGEGGKINRRLVQELVSPSREEKAWEIQTAIVSGDRGESLKKFRELVDISRQDIVPLSWAVIDLMRKLYAAAVRLKKGEPPGVICRDVKLWGPVADGALRVARTIEPDRLAQLLHHAIETDRRNKSGYGNPERSLEALLARIADTIGRAS